VPSLLIREGGEGAERRGPKAERVSGSLCRLPLDDWQSFLEKTLDGCLVAGFGLESSKHSYSHHVFSPFSRGR